MFKVRREFPARKLQRPFCRWLVFTGEPLNPYRCESCLTVKQGKYKLEKIPEKRLLDVVERPGCCRKCGVDF